MEPWVKGLLESRKVSGLCNPVPVGGLNPAQKIIGTMSLSSLGECKNAHA